MNPSEMATNLTELERELRDRFVDEYLKDYDQTRALIRCGYAQQYAKDYAIRFMAEPYTLSRLEEKSRELGVMTEDDIHRKRIIAGLYREANNMGTGSSHGGRVSAYSQLSKILGIEAPVKTQTEMKVTGIGPDVSHLSVADLEAIKNKVYGKPPAVPAPSQ